MKPTTNILLTIIFIVFPFILNCQTSDYYSVKLRSIHENQEILYDTIVAIDYLREKSNEGLPNMQIFERFNYQRFELTLNKNTTTLFNDTIRINISTKPVDSIEFMNNYLYDSSLFFNNLYYINIPLDIFQTYPFLPEVEVSKISLIINGKIKQIPSSQYKSLYNPSLGCWRFNKDEKCGVNGYVTDNNKILLTLECGEGAGSYIVIFVFDQTGKLEKKIEESVI